MKVRSSFINLTILFLTCILLLIFAELFLKYFVHPVEIPFWNFNTTDKIVNYDTNGPRRGTYSFGPLAHKQGRWRINNLGWNSDVDYDTKKRDKPLIAIIGDSYIEAFQVDVSKSIAARLREKLAGKFDVYSFGISGVGLSEFLQISRYVRKYFDPEILVINVNHDSFGRSLDPTKTGELYVKIINGQAVEAPIVPLVPLLQRPDAYNRLKVFLCIHSSLFRYLALNCHLYRQVILKLINIFNHKADYITNNKEVTDKIDIAINYIIETFKRENENKKIIFMIDAPRYDIYLNKLKGSDIYWMNLFLNKLCKKYDVGFIDLTKSFNDAYICNHRPFNEDYDYHWNEYGHEMATEALLTFLQNYPGLMVGDTQKTP
jgi:hypothetical protein